MAETLQCQPIRGVDLPLPKLDDLIQVEEIEGHLFPTNQPTSSGILSMLLPNELKVASQHFLEEEDIDYMPIVTKPKKTKVQQIRESKPSQEVEFERQAQKILKDEKDEELLKVSADERRKTI